MIPQIPYGQIGAILRLELRKSIFTRRAWWIYLLALGPVLLTAGHSLVMSHRETVRCSLGEDYQIYAGLFHLFYLRLGIFFGCFGIFVSLFRNETLEKTLHYYLLAPVRREWLVAGKFLAGFAAAVFFFGGSAVVSYLAIGAHFGPQWEEHMLAGPGLAHLLQYFAVVILACAGYGAVFLLLGVVVRNPLLPAALILGWEGINVFLPPLLKKISVIFYLQALCPVEAPLKFQDAGPLALLAIPAEPPPAWAGIGGLLVVAALLLWLSARRARRIEVSYGE